MNFKTTKEFIQFISDEQRCIDLIKQVRWGGHACCTFCKHNKVYELKGEYKRFKCAQCKRHFSVTKGTIFENSPIPLSKWLEAIYYLISRKRGISSPQLSREIGVTVKTAWFMLARIRCMLRENAVKVAVDEYVQIDETFVGGKNKNRHKNKRVEKSQGRSFKDKTPVIGILVPETSMYLQRPHKVIPSKMVLEKVVLKPARLICKVVRDTKARSLKPFIYQTVEKGATIVTDEWGAYKDLKGLYDHHIVNHRLNQYVNDEGYTTNGIENAWTHFKGMIIGNYRNISRRHLHRYVDEYCFRYNNRHSDNDKGSLLSQSFTNIERRLTWKSLVRKNAA